MPNLGWGQKNCFKGYNMRASIMGAVFKIFGFFQVHNKVLCTEKLFIRWKVKSFTLLWFLMKFKILIIFTTKQYFSNTDTSPTTFQNKLQTWSDVIIVGVVPKAHPHFLHFKYHKKPLSILGEVELDTLTSLTGLTGLTLYPFTDEGCKYATFE